MLDRSPFEVLHGYTPQHFGIQSSNACPSPVLADWLQEKQVMQALIQQHLLRAQRRMKAQADKKGSERHFNTGSLVIGSI